MPLPAATPRDRDAFEALRLGLAESGAGLCLCDASDRVRLSNRRFRAAFFAGLDPRGADFIDAVLEGARAGSGLRVTSAAPDDFARLAREARRALVGSRSFSADLLDDSWWSVTDTRLSNGWMLVAAQDITGVKREQARLREAHEAALAEANTDFLTGIPNRRHGLRRAEALWREVRQGGGRLAVALVDVDHFKAINDVYGHEAGDRALVHLARGLAAAAAPDEQVSRLGGDEFLVLRPGVGARAFEAALAATVAGLPTVSTGCGGRVRLSLSVGVAEARAGDTWPGLMHRADAALYDAKAGGRSRIARAG